MIDTIGGGFFPPEIPDATELSIATRHALHIVENTYCPPPDNAKHSKEHIVSTPTCDLIMQAIPASVRVLRRGRDVFGVVIVPERVDVRICHLQVMKSIV